MRYYIVTLKLTELGRSGKGGVNVTSRVEAVHVHVRRDRNCDNPYPSRDGNHCFGDPLNYDVCHELPCSSKLEHFNVYDNSKTL